ncbi:DUF4010 domain-containing protein [Pseudomonas sp. R2.Fl]|nr:DUF4010 domain-containing protein [Pseudomonas sp. R2.Fl]
MDNLELFQRLGLAIAIGAAVGVERHWREREEREGARTAGIRTFTMFGMLGGVAGLLEKLAAGSSAYPGVVLGVFLLALSAVMVIFSLREAIADESFSVTTVIAAMLTFSLGALAMLGDVVIASAGGAALVAILAAREFLHGAVRRLKWIELRSAVILLAMTFVLLPVIPEQPIGPFGGVSPKSILVLAILLASISFAGYLAVRLLGPSKGDVIAGAIGGLVSSTATTITFAQRAAAGEPERTLAAGAVSAGAVSIFRTAVLVAGLASPLIPVALPPLVAAAVVMAGFALVLAWRESGSTGESASANPFELWSVLKMAVLLIVVAFVTRAASQFFGGAGLLVAAGLSGLADVDAATVTVTGMMGSLTVDLASAAIGVAVVANLMAKAVYGTVFGTRIFAAHLWLATIAAVATGGIGIAISALV